MFRVLNLTFHLLGIIVLVATVMLCVPRKRSLPATIAAFFAVFIALYVADHFTGIFANPYFPNVYAFLPVMIFFFKGHIFQRFFALFMQSFISVAISLFAGMTYGFFVPYGSREIFLLMMITSTVLYTLYIILMYRYGRRFLNMIFEKGTKAEWALYMASAGVAHLAIFVLRLEHEGNNLIHYLLLIFIIWSFAILCFAIINTNEKSRQKSEADFMRNLIISSEGHYEKMNELYTSLRIMRHDAKYHQRVILEYLQKGETAKAVEYLGGLQTEFSKYELISFCNNQVINALLVNFAERCEKSGVDFTAKITLSEKCAVSDYDMCILIGNLLENAFTASQQLETGRKISLDMISPNDQLILKVTNNFKAKSAKEATPSTDGASSGLGLRSVQLVAARYGGELLVKQENGVWTASVLINIIHN